MNNNLTGISGLALLIIIISAVFYSGCSSVDRRNAGRVREDRIMKSKNYNGKIFINPVPVKLMKDGTMSDTMWKLISVKEERRPKQKLGPFESDTYRINSANTSGLRVTWINHSTVLIEIDGKRFITDPVWSKRASPVFFAGPSRFFDPPLKLEDLPHLDGVIISHDHYDHLDDKTIKKLADTGVNFFMPLGVGKYFFKWGIRKEHIHEFDWWESIKIGDHHMLTAAPACHFSGRGLFDRNETLWASWIIEGEKHSVYFGGDSGYFPGYKEIGEKYGPFDLVILEIGAYHPNWGAIHLGPVNAVQAQIDLKGKAMLPVHWGTFELAFHAWYAPVEELIAEAEARSVRLILPHPGQTISELNKSYNSEWWIPQKSIKINNLVELAN
jgi:L-ascorbate metabolism protein UlaG (beta-lactamase superfamily)